MDRRDFMLASGAVGLAMAASKGRAGERLSLPSEFVAASTTAGKVAGITNDGIHQFRSIPYGASTAGKGRFLPPQPPISWNGLHKCYGFGEIAPQAFSAPEHPFGRLIDFDLHVGAMGEDCLNLNVWTSGIGDQRRRPVLVYFHGGGFSAGTANHYLYEGDALARYGEVVVVTVNHRLSAFGYLDLADFGTPGEFADAPNCGHLDMVRSLQWVRDNIAEFGGDPGNVTIFGQSGGGSKVWHLMMMPAAKGLFHRALIQSGSGSVIERSALGDASRALIARLGIRRGDWQALQAISFEQIVDAQIAMGTYNWINPKAPPGPSPQFGPVVDGRNLPFAPFDSKAFAAGASVPAVIGYCHHDSGWPKTNFDIDDHGLLDVAATLAGKGRAAAAVQLYERAYPDTSPFLLQAAMLTDAGLLQDVSTMASGKAALGKAPAFVYRFDWQSKAVDGRFGAVHGMDMCLVFHNSVQATLGGDTLETRGLADTMADWLLAFARDGVPKAKDLPSWSPYSPARRETMVIDRPYSRLIDDPNGELRTFWGSPRA
jgi:para-nitrobenzyl esterase